MGQSPAKLRQDQTTRAKEVRDEERLAALLCATLAEYDPDARQTRVPGAGEWLAANGTRWLGQRRFDGQQQPDQFRIYTGTDQRPHRERPKRLDASKRECVVAGRAGILVLRLGSEVELGVITVEAVCIVSQFTQEQGIATRRNNGFAA